MQRSLARAWAAVVTNATLMRSRSSYTCTDKTHSYACLFVCFSEYVCLFAFLSIPDSWLPITDFSLLIQSYTPTCVLVCLCLCTFFFWVSIPCSWLPNSLFLLDTGILFWITTSCQPCQRTFLPVFHRFSECACFTWLSTETLCLSESVDFLSLLDMCWPVFLVLLVCVCVCVLVSRCVPGDEQTQ